MDAVPSEPVATHHEHQGNHHELGYWQADPDNDLRTDAETVGLVQS